MSGVFLAVEGGEGAGKSTQIALLRGVLTAEGHEVVVTFEPGDSELGAQIRSLLLHGGHVSPRAEALLYAADRAHHVDTVILPALARGAVVVTDRYVDSTLAYQGVGRGLDVRPVNAFATDGLVPALTLFLDVDPAVGLARARGAGAGDRIEAESVAFHEAVRRAFLDLAAAAGDRAVVVDADRDPAAVHADVVTAVRRVLP